MQRFDQAAKMMRRMSNKVGAGVPGFGGPAMGGGKGKGIDELDLHRWWRFHGARRG